jgi:leader peptidase (prepilin peptidase) / N-methyltransferase
MIRILATVFAGLLGLAFGSFLNVCVTRWPAGESVAHPRSHCRSCGRTLAWWENIPLASWLALRGRCRSCKIRISWRYPLVELAIGALWGIVASRLVEIGSEYQEPILQALIPAILSAILLWFLVALAVLDAENLWLPNFLTYPGILLGLIYSAVNEVLGLWSPNSGHGTRIFVGRLMFLTLNRLLAALAAAGLILLIRWIYWLIRRREGIGLGDAKLMAMLAAWLGFSGALVSFALGVVLGVLAAITVLIAPATRAHGSPPTLTKLPLGAFLCVGGIISSLWGQQILAGYLRWAGF